MNPNQSSIPSRPGNFAEKLKRMCTEQPLIPIGVITTVGFLFAGLRAMRAGNKAQSQMMMRGRVAAQGLTVFAIYLGITSLESKKSKEPVTDVSRQL
jgi:hypothetical protein